MENKNITFEEILSNRRKWVDFLKSPERTKLVGYLDDGHENRCCLGHACAALDFEPDDVKIFHGSVGYIAYDRNTEILPSKLVIDLGLRANCGELSDVCSDYLIWNKVNKVVEGTANIKDMGMQVMPKDIHYSRSLAELNDETDATPQQIGAYLETVINGGKDTPFYDAQEWLKLC